MTDTINRYFAAMEGINPRLTIGSGVLMLAMAGKGLVVYLQPFA